MILKKPYSHDNKKIFITKIVDGIFMYMDNLSTGNYTKDINRAHDYKSFDFAEQMIITNKYKEVMITQHYI